jgi:hypothetical protein
VAERGSGRTVRAAPADGAAYLAKAHEYLEAAEDALARENFVAAVGNAVHATIAAADAVASVRLGSRWKSDLSVARIDRSCAPRNAGSGLPGWACSPGPGSSPLPR